MKVDYLLLIMCLLSLASCRGITSEPTNAVTVTQASIQTASPINTSTNPAQEPSLVFFTSEAGKFQVWLPVSENIQEFTITKTLFGEPVECSSLFFGLNSASAGVQYCDLVSQSIASLSSDEILDEVESEIIQSLHLKPDTQERVLAQDTYPATAFSGHVDMRGMGYDGTFKARLILAESRVYLAIMSVYQENWCNCRHQMNQVVDSLAIDTGLSIPFEPTP